MTAPGTPTRAAGIETTAHALLRPDPEEMPGCFPERRHLPRTFTHCRRPGQPSPHWRRRRKTEARAEAETAAPSDGRQAETAQPSWSLTEPCRTQPARLTSYSHSRFPKGHISNTDSNGKPIKIRFLALIKAGGTAHRQTAVDVSSAKPSEPQSSWFRADPLPSLGEPTRCHTPGGREKTKRFLTQGQESTCVALASILNTVT